MRYFFLTVLFAALLVGVGILPQWLWEQLPSNWPVELQLGVVAATVVGLLALIPALDCFFQKILVRQENPRRR